MDFLHIYSRCVLVAFLLLMVCHSLKVCTAFHLKISRIQAQFKIVFFFHWTSSLVLSNSIYRKSSASAVSWICISRCRSDYLSRNSGAVSNLLPKAGFSPLSSLCRKIIVPCNGLFWIGKHCLPETASFDFSLSCCDC